MLKSFAAYPLPLREGHRLVDAPQMMGIVNITPDSFSDGGLYMNECAVLQRVARLLDDGASIIDVGGESTRPNASVVEISEEKRRVIAVVKRIKQEFDCLVSVDTSQPDVFSAAFDVGADWWNDVRALRRPGAAQLAAKLGVPVVVMHMRGEPSTMNQMATYKSPVEEVLAELQVYINRVLEAGVRADRLLIDPGFGFAKHTAHNVALLQHIDQFATLGYPLVIGVSRKRFIGELSGLANASDRDEASATAALLAVMQGAHIVRMHEVKPLAALLNMWRKIVPVLP